VAAGTSGLQAENTRKRISAAAQKASPFKRLDFCEHFCPESLKMNNSRLWCPVCFCMPGAIPYQEMHAFWWVQPRFTLFEAEKRYFSEPVITRKSDTNKCCTGKPILPWSVIF
jgi:hypothetical protein